MLPAFELHIFSIQSTISFIVYGITWQLLGAKAMLMIFHSMLFIGWPVTTPESLVVACKSGLVDRQSGSVPEKDRSNPVDSSRNDNIIITSKRRCDVVLT